MPANASPEFSQAEKRFDQATSDEDKLSALEEMIKTMPQHKSAESLRSNLRTRYKKLKEKMESKGKGSKSGGGKASIKKEDTQAAIVGFPNSGKSFLFKTLTSQEALISDVAFSTYEATPGMMNFENAQVQIIDMPPFPNEDKSIINTADTILIVINNAGQIQESEKYLERSTAKRIYIFTKTDFLNDAERRKLEANLKSKYKNIEWILFSNTEHTNEELKNLKQKIFSTFPIIRIYTKEPKKEAGNIPMIMKTNSTASDVAEKILKGMSGKLKKIKIWGPSSKFPGQLVGKDHILRDKDVIEFQTE